MSGCRSAPERSLLWDSLLARKGGFAILTAYRLPPFEGIDHERFAPAETCGQILKAARWRNDR